MDNPHTMSKYASRLECLEARDKWSEDRIKKLEKALEFAEYMAKNAEHYQAACRQFDEAFEQEDDDLMDQASESCTEAHTSLVSGIYEFRKRAAKCQ